MKKLIFGDKLIKTEETICDFCGEIKICFRDKEPVSEEVEVVWYLESKKSPSDFYDSVEVGGGFLKFSETVWFYKEDMFEHMHVGHITKKRGVRSLHVCQDCAKQMAKLQLTNKEK